MDREGFDIQMFILQKHGSFKNKDYNDKVLTIIEKSDNKIQSWYYKQGSKNLLPTNIDRFISSLWRFINSENIKCIN